MHRGVDAALARTLQVEQDRILTRLIRGEVPIVTRMLFAHATDGAFNGGGLVRHRP